MMELLLDLKCPDQNQEPYFRHIVKKWTRDPSQNTYQVSIHQQMTAHSLPILANLHDTMQQTYGHEVANDVLNNIESNDSSYEGRSIGNTTIPTMSLDTNDRYVNGPAQFIIKGMEALDPNDNRPTLQEQKQQEDDNYTMGVDSEGTNLTQETSRTNDQTERNPNTDLPENSRDIGRPQWSRVGSIEAEQRLFNRLSPNRIAPDPELTQGKQP